MSGDVQPRKRKDKKRKRDSIDRKSDGDIVFSRKESLQPEEEEVIHHGVHATKMGTEDVHLHIQSEHGTGGHWCAKMFFFSLMAVLFGLVGLIIMENRGLSDLDTPLKESRFSEYFEGWVDEIRDEHDDHNVVAHEIEEHDLHDEPFEEVEENDTNEEDHDDEHNDHDDDDDDDEHNETEDDDEALNDNEDDDDDDDEQSQGNDDDDDDNDETVERESKNINDNDDEDQQIDDDDDNDDDNDDDDESIEPILTKEKREIPLNNQPKQVADSKEDDDDDNLNDDDDDDDDETENIHKNNINDENDDDPFDEEEDDGNFDSLEGNIVDNDAEELRLLQKKAEQAAQNNAPKEEESSSSPLAVKIIVGLALALVARLVLIKKRPEGDTRLTIEEKVQIEEIHSNDDELLLESPNEIIYDVEDAEVLDAEYYEEDEPYSENDDQIDEEIDEKEEEQEINNFEPKKTTDETKMDTYIPETFEQFNAMYRPIANISSNDKDPKLQVDVKLQTTRTIEFKPKLEEIKKPNVELTSPMPPPRRFEGIPRNNQQIRMEMPLQAGSSYLRHVPLPPPNEQSVQEKITAAKLAATIASPVRLMESHKMDDENNEMFDDFLNEEEMYEEEVDEEEDNGEEGENESDIDDDDDDLMKRLEEKYGKLPAGFESDNDEEEDEDEDTSWTKIKPRAGGGPQSYREDDLIEDELAQANEQMLRDNYKAALKIYESLALKYPDSPGSLYGKAKTLDHLAEIYSSNEMLTEAIHGYKRFLALGDIINDELFRTASQQCIVRMRFLGLFMQAVPIHQQLIERFDDEPIFRNDLAVTYLSINRLNDAQSVIENILKRWPNNGFALVHYGFVLKALNLNLEEAVHYLHRGIESGENGTQDGRFYFNLGDALTRLGRINEAKDIFRKGAEKKLFLSEYQRSLYNVENLKAQPFWTKKETNYEEFFNLLESNWRQIREEGISALTDKGYFIDEAESLKDIGNWQQFELFARGYKKIKNCEKVPVTCKLIEIFPAARYCKRGQTKFSVMHPGTHVWPHCGPTNCRLRAHLGLKIPLGTKIRVANEERTWEEGKFLIFDDSFEHEVWHNGTSLRLVLIIDVWHPDLSDEQIKSLGSI